jgi:integrase
MTQFLDWLVTHEAIAANPFVDLQRNYECRQVAPIIRALLGPKPTEALEALRPLPHYGSHLGPLMREHVDRMRTLGFRYTHEYMFLQFDRFLQRRPDASRESFSTLLREYASLAPSATTKLRRIHVGRVLASALNRRGFPAAPPERDALLVREELRKRCRPYIYTAQEVSRLLETALSFPSPLAPLRPVALYTMLVLAYCAGLRLGEIVRLKLQDVDLDEEAIEIRDTKFFKSRRLPLSSSAMAALRDYLEARRKAGAPEEPNAPLFWHCKGAYSYSAVGALLKLMIRRAGLHPGKGHGPRLHDLRHTFVVHRMTVWYQQGINPQNRLPYLAAYLGHRNIYSTLVYLTVTQELLQHANERFRAAEADVLKVIQGEP